MLSIAELKKKWFAHRTLPFGCKVAVYNCVAIRLSRQRLDKIQKFEEEHVPIIEKLKVQKGICAIEGCHSTAQPAKRYCGEHLTLQYVRLREEEPERPTIVINLARALQDTLAKDIPKIKKGYPKLKCNSVRQVERLYSEVQKKFRKYGFQTIKQTNKKHASYKTFREVRENRKGLFEQYHNTLS